MKHLKRWFSKPLKLIPNSLVIFALVVALLGFADASYLTIEHYQGVIPPCSVVEGCEQVLTSEFAVVAGIPVALVGAIYYLLISIGIFAYLESKNEKLLKLALLIPVIGFLATLYFLYLQVFVIGAYCLYCLGSALVTTILFIISLTVFSRYSASDTL